MPLFSIIIPVYNTEKYLEKSLSSAFDQTFKDYEVIIINDNSTDRSEQIIERFRTNNETKLKYIKKTIKLSEGPSDVRNRGIEEISGKYFLFLDSDDYIEKELLEKLSEELEKNEDVDLIKYKLETVDENYENIAKFDGAVFEKCSGEEAFNKLCFTDKLLESPTIYLYKTEYFKENKFKFREGYYHEDFALLPLVIAKANSVVSLDYYPYYYLQSQNSVTRTDDIEKKKKKIYDIIYHYDFIKEEVEQYGLSEKTIENIKIYATNAVILSLKNVDRNDRKEFIKEIKKRKLYKNIKARSLKQMIKRLLFKFNINLYLKVR